jgi:adenine deaminase
VVIEDLKYFEVVMTIKDGEVVFEEGVLKVQPSVYIEPEVTNTVSIAEITPESFKLRINSERAHVIGLIKNQIVTAHQIEEVKRNNQGEVISDPERDILKIAVIERHHASGNIGLGLLSGLGLKRGAIAQTVAHDSHNIIVVGTNDQDMYVAVKAIRAMQGGFVVVENGMVKAGLSLPIAGLISPLKAEEVALHMEQLCVTAKQLGVIPQNPFLSLAFVALPVIPKLRLTDKGLVDVEKFEFIPLEAA